MNVQPELNKLWAGIVEKSEFNTLNHIICFKIKTIDAEIVQLFNMTFSKVSSFYFIEDIGTRRFNPVDPDPGDYIEDVAKLVSTGCWTDKNYIRIRKLGKSMAFFC